MPSSSSAPGAFDSKRARRVQRLRWALWRWRYVISCVAIAVVVMVIVGELRPTSEPTRAVVVLRAPVSAGQVINARDVHLVDVPTALVPDDALLTPDDASGRSAAIELSSATVVTKNVLAGGEARALAPPGSVIVPVRLSDATITGFVNVGDHVDLVLVPDHSFDTSDDASAAVDSTSGTSVLAERALVLPTPAPEQAQSSGLLAGPVTEQESASFLLVAVTAQEARTLTASARSGYIGAVLVE